jgi:hypothetical protein
MRKLTSTELQHVYGGGGCYQPPPCKPPKCKTQSKCGSYSYECKPPSYSKECKPASCS